MPATALWLSLARIRFADSCIQKHQLHSCHRVIRPYQPFKIYDGAAVQPFIDALDASEMEVSSILHRVPAADPFSELQRGAPGNAMEQ
jgi:hypothetical protein